MRDIVALLCGVKAEYSLRTGTRSFSGGIYEVFRLVARSLTVADLGSLEL